MIQDYLKTSLVFYDDIDKQHRSNDCCLENENWNKLISPDDRFLPFQIRIPTDEWVGDIQTVRLYDEDDVLVENLITDYGIRNVMWVLSNCFWNDTWVWVIYNGGTLSDTLPEGNHYIRITDDAGNAWYSEMFSICDLTQVDANADEELLVEWENGAGVFGTFNVLTTDGGNITYASEAAAGGGGGSVSNQIDGRTGDRFSFVIDFQKFSGGNIWSMFLTEFGDETVVLSNAVNLPNTDVYEGVFTTTGNGPYQLVFQVAVGAIAQEASAGISIRRIIPATYTGMIGIEWYNNCDFDGIIYQNFDNWHVHMEGFVNRLYFPVKLESPRTETTKDGSETLGVFNTNNIVQKKFYMFKVLVPEFLYNVLQTLQLYANNTRSIVNIFLDNGDVGEIMELNILEEWVEGNCYATLTVEFREAAVVWTNCCDNYQLYDESSCS